MLPRIYHFNTSKVILIFLLLVGGAGKSVRALTALVKQRREVTDQHTEHVTGPAHRTVSIRGDSSTKHSSIFAVED